MSYILNAIRKSEQQRQQAEDLTVNKPVSFNSTKPQIARKTNFLPLILFINFIILGYIVWLINATEERTDIQENQASSPPSSTIETINQQREHFPPPNKQFNTPEQDISDIAEQIKRKQAKKIKPMAAKPVLTAKNKAVGGLKEKKTEIKKQLPAPKTQTLKSINTQTKTTDYAYLSELDYSFQRAVPDLNINVYVYTEQQQQRFIMVDMQKYRAGEEIKPGLTLKEISIDSLRLEYQGHQFLIKRP